MDTGRRGRALAGLLLAAALAGCGGGPRGERDLGPLASWAAVSVDDERERGYQADAALRASLDMVDDPVVLRFVHDVGHRITHQLGDQPFLYRFRVVKDPALNAFALPGGYVFVTSGTLLAAGSTAELAGVLSHEVAHVQRHHYARMVEQATIPDLVTKLAGLGAAIATRNAAPLIAAQGASLALQLRYTREFEDEADAMAIALMARADFPPEGLVHFFERIEAKENDKDYLTPPPPYLKSHPDVADRIDAAMGRLKTVSGTHPVDPALERSFSDVKGRIDVLLATDRSTSRAPAHVQRASAADPLLAEAGARERAGDAAGALQLLQGAAAEHPADARVAFRLGELLEASGRTEDAVAAWQRSAALEPDVALTYLRIGIAERSLGNREEAAFALEQAEVRAEPGGTLQKKAHELSRRLTFPVIEESGVAAGDGDPAEALGHREATLAPATDHVVWWARVSDSYAGRRDRIQVQLDDPGGHRVAECGVETQRDDHVTAELALADGSPPALGIWRVEARLDGDRVARTTFRVGPVPEDEAAAANATAPAPGGAP